MILSTVDRHFLFIYILCENIRPFQILPCNTNLLIAGFCEGTVNLTKEKIAGTQNTVERSVPDCSDSDLDCKLKEKS